MTQLHMPAQVATVSQQEISTKKVSNRQVTYDLPARLQIPKINVDAAVESMGLTAGGNMEAPQDNEGVGWYKYGPHPGEVGSAVIAGHLGVQEQSVFMNLDKLQKGDRMSIRDKKGQTIWFVVRKIRAYNQTEKPSEVFHSTGGVHLNLITCAGVWNAAERLYSQRLVVFADKSFK